MAAIQLNNNFTNSLADTAEVVYTSPSAGAGTLISAFTAVNNSTSNKSYKAYIVGSTESISSPIRPFKIVIWGEEDLGAGIDGQTIPPGGTLQVEASAANSIYFTVTGVES